MQSAQTSSTPVSFFAFLLACLLASTLLPKANDASASEPGSTHQQAFDRVRQVLYVIQNGGVIRVLNVNRTLGEIGTLRTPGQHALYDVRLDDSGRWLWVLADNGVYRYDTRTLRQVAFEARNSPEGTHFARVDEHGYHLPAFPAQSAPNV